VFRLKNQTLKEELLFDSVKTADNFFIRAFGLIFRRELKPDEGLLFYKCNSIQTFWMRFAVDVIFLDKNNKILALIAGLKPFRVTPFIKGADKALELRKSSIKNSELELGDMLLFE
ncbi:MAG: DUF192 domain-containing protein, partial [Actinobacteria bacterium]|nr:DUF192 domain-containing protein [Actinomycetota bacterium]